jgi:hypothetical protein
MKYQYIYETKGATMFGSSSANGKRYLHAFILVSCLILFVLFGAGCRKLGQASEKDVSTVNSALSGQTASSQTASRGLTWSYRGIRFTCHIKVPQQLLDWDRKIYQLTAGFYSGQYSQADLAYMPAEFKRLVLSDSLQEGGDFVPWVNDMHNSQLTGDIANQLASYARHKGFDYFRTAEFIQSFVCGAIPYQVTDAPELPAQTLIDNGDCKDKSILLAALLKNLSYKVTLLEFPPQGGKPGHMAVGVAFSDSQIPGNKSLSYYRYKGYKYYFAETTAPNWPLGAASVDEPAHVYDVN